MTAAPPTVPYIEALLATLVLFLTFVFLRRAFDWTQRWVDSWLIGSHKPGRIHRWILHSPRAGRVLHGVGRWLRVGFAVGLVYGYAAVLFRLSPSTAPYASALHVSFAGAMRMVGELVAVLLPHVVVIAAVGGAAYMTIKVARLLFHELGTKALRWPGFYPDWADPTFKIVRLLVLAASAVVVFHYLPGSGSPAFEGVSLFLGALVSLGSGSAVAHMVAGTVLTYTRAFQVGDRIRVGDAEGDVIEKTLLVTRIRTIKNVDISIPNASVLAQQIVNFSSSADRRGLILHTTVTLGYDVPWRTVHAHLIDAALATTHVQADPPPYVLQTALNDFHATYQINAYTDQPLLSAEIYSELHQNIQDALHAGGIEIMSPHYLAIRDGSGRAVPNAHPSGAGTGRVAPWPAIAGPAAT